MVLCVVHVHWHKAELSQARSDAAWVAALLQHARACGICSVYDCDVVLYLPLYSKHLPVALSCNNCAAGF